MSRHIPITKDAGPAALALGEMQVERDEAEAQCARLFEECRQQRERAELLERTAAVTMCERDAAQKLADGWKAAALNKLGVCGTCEGSGIMYVGGGDGPHDPEEPLPCGECDGTGRGEVAFAFERLHEQMADEERMAEKSGGILSDVCDAAFGDEERAETHGYDGIVEQVQELRRAWINVEGVAEGAAEAIAARKVAVDALTAAVAETTETTALGQVLRRALGMCR